jgi:mannose-6-phosphate isomerase-like protein (cupin superfamily)
LSKALVIDMDSFGTNVELKTIKNTNYREVLVTGQNMQLVLMSLKPGEDIPKEVHTDIEQFIRAEAGEGMALIGGKEYPLKDGDAVIVPCGVEHYIKNTSETEDLKLYTIYAGPEHPDGTIHKTKAEADAYEEEHHH